MLGRSLPAAFLGVTGSHLTGMNTGASLAAKRKRRRPITQRDVNRVLGSAHAQHRNRSFVLHVIPRSYLVDGQGGVRDPIGVAAEELAVDSHVVSANTGPVEDLVRVVKAAGVKVKGLVVEHLASSEAVLSEEERKRGVVLADIGGGTTDVAVFEGGALFHTVSIPVAGQQFTTDVSVGLGIPVPAAEEAKVQHGSVVIDGVEPSDRVSLQIPGHAEAWTVSQRTLNMLLRDRAIELVRLILRSVQESGLERMPRAGLVLTGGSANLAGLVELAQEYAHCPVRMGSPSRGLGLPKELEDASLATGVGLLLWGIHHRHPSPVSPEFSFSTPVLVQARDWVRRFVFEQPEEAAVYPVGSPVAR